MAPDPINVGAHSRFDLTRAIVHDGSFRIDRYVANTVDWSRRGGHYYSNKAPGVSLLAAPIYWAVVRVEQALGVDPQARVDANLRLVDLAATALPSVLLALLLLAYLTRHLRVPAEAAWLAVFAASVGSVAFPYSTMLWGHQTGALFLFLAFYALLRLRRSALAGLCAGLAVLCEYSTAVALPALAALALWPAPVSADVARRAQPRSLAAFCAAGLPALAVFGAYHQICFGGVLTLATAFNNPAQIAQPTAGPYGSLGAPSLEALWGISFGRKGLFASAPVFLLAVPGFARWLRGRAHRAEGAAALWTVAGFVLFNVTFNAWHGGWCVGPRYLTPVLPFLAAALAWCAPRFVAWPLAALGAANMLAFVATDVTPPHGQESLLRSAWPMLRDTPALWPAFAGMLALASALFALALWSGFAPGRPGPPPAHSSKLAPSTAGTKSKGSEALRTSSKRRSRSASVWPGS